MSTSWNVSEDWTPTPKNLNALPSTIRRYILDLQTDVDSAGLMQENFRLRQENVTLRRECERLAALVRVEKKSA